MDIKLIKCYFLTRRTISNEVSVGCRDVSSENKDTTQQLYTFLQCKRGDNFVRAVSVTIHKLSSGYIYAPHNEE